jgi:hypothetical protein
MKKIIVFLIISSFLLVSCKDKTHFKVTGTIGEASGEMLYLEQVSLERLELLDSVKLTKSGNFSFKVERPVYPDFYRLRMKNKTILFAVDSTEQIVIKSKLSSFSDDYDIKGSENLKKIKELKLSADRLQKKIDDLYRDKNRSLTEYEKQDLATAFNAHKKLARIIISASPLSTAAYYAIFQKVNNVQLFDPSNDEDLKWYAAVATSYSTFYPHSLRGKHLINLVLQSKRNKRTQELKKVLLQKSEGVIDIDLPNVNEENIALSSLKGKVVLLDFCCFANKNSKDQLPSLFNAYKKYKQRGFEIYTVSFDDNYDAWKLLSKDIPWVSVYDNNALNSGLILDYNLSKLPTLYLLNRHGDIVSRHALVNKELYSEIDRLLR